MDYKRSSNVIENLRYVRQWWKKKKRNKWLKITAKSNLNYNKIRLRFTFNFEFIRLPYKPRNEKRPLIVNSGASKWLEGGNYLILYFMEGKRNEQKVFI